MAEKTSAKKMVTHQISKKSLILWEIGFLILWAVVLGVILWLFTPFTWLWYLLVWLMGVLVILIELLYLPLFYQAANYSINDRLLIYRHGVFFRKQQAIYRDRIIYVSVYNTPITPVLGISSLVIATAGAKIRIPFLNKKAALQLADELLPSS